jgi:putative endonuclease
MTTYKNQIGAWGEEVAAEWLTQRGYRITARNVRTPYGEIDIVAQQKDVTVFVEVKTLTSSKNLLPEHNITPRKLQHMLNSAQQYANANEIDHWQVDVIAVEGKPKSKPPVITHFENVG